MKKLTVMILVLCLLLAGCAEEDKTYTFDIQTGETVKVTLDPDAGMEISTGNQSFTLTKDGVQASCDFVEADLIDDYFEWIPGAPGGECIDWGENDYGTYMFYSFDHGAGVEYGYVCEFDGTYIGIMITNEISEASIREAAACLSFEYEQTVETTGE